MYGIKYILNAVDSIIISASARRQNTTDSLRYILGRQIRGIFANKYSKLPNIKATELHKDDRFYKWFLADDIMYTNAYPIFGEQTYYPTPISIRKKKYTDEIINMWYESDSHTSPVFQLSVIQEDQIYLYLPSVSMTFHHQQKIDDNEIFYYKSLDKEQIFEGYILCNNKAELEEFLEEFSKKITAKIGKSKNTQYGSITIELDSVKEFFGEIEKTDDFTNEQFPVFFISDALFLDKNGQSTLSIDIILKYICSKLGITRNDVITTSAFIKAKVVDNYIPIWKAKHPKENLVAAGSIIYLQFKHSIADTKIAELNSTSIGEHINEGLGRISTYITANHKNYTIEKAENELKRPKQIPVLTKQILETIVRKRLLEFQRNNAYDDVHILISENKELPSNSLVYSLAQSGNIKLETDKLQKIAKDQLLAIKIKQETLYDYIQKYEFDKNIIDKQSNKLIKLAEVNIDNMKKDLEKEYWQFFFMTMTKMNKGE